MKRSLLILLTSIIFAKTNGQITKGNWLVGGTGSYVSEKISITNETRKTQQITIAPNIGYFIIDNFTVGLKPELGFIKREYPTSPYFVTERINHLSIGPFLRYYFFPNERVFNLVAQSEFLVGRYKYNPENQPDQKEPYKSWSLGIGPVIFFNSSVALETIAGYKQVHFNNNNQINKSFQFLIGLQIHLQKLE